MKNLIFILLLTLSLAACKSAIAYDGKEDAANFKFEENILYYKGFIASIWPIWLLQEKNGKIRREIVIAIDDDSTDLSSKAMDIIKYVSSRIKNSDIELKQIIKTNKANK